MDSLVQFIICLFEVTVWLRITLNALSCIPPSVCSELYFWRIDFRCIILHQYQFLVISFFPNLLYLFRNKNAWSLGMRETKKRNRLNLYIHPLRKKIWASIAWKIQTCEFFKLFVALKNVEILHCYSLHYCLVYDKRLGLNLINHANAFPHYLFLPFFFFHLCFQKIPLLK